MQEQQPKARRSVAWFSATIAVVAAAAAVSSAIVAWKALSAYPDQLATSERLRACVAMQEKSARFVSAVAGYQTYADQPDDEMFHRHVDAVSAADAETFTLLSIFQMLGPADVRDAGVELRNAHETPIRAAENGQRDSELHDELQSVATAQRALGIACARAVRGQ